MASTPVRSQTSIARWGAACAQCATAKAKCIRSTSTPGAKCDRCERLLKDCKAQVHRQRKKRETRQSHPLTIGRRTAELENKLNGLVNLLKSSGGITDADLNTDTTCIPTEVDPAVSNQQSPSQRPTRTFPACQSPWAIPETYNCYAPPSCICRPESGDAPPPPDTDENLLNLYRNDLQPVNPFVVVPQNMTAAELKEKRPFLMSAIRMVTSFRSLRSMRAQMYHLMKHIAEHMLIRSQRSLDLLMGTIVITSWYQYHCFMHAQLNNLIALAGTLVGELGLHRSPNIQERTTLMVVNPSEPEERTNEERRALAGVWYLSSAISLGFQRYQPMRYTKYIQQCVKVLEEEREYATDVKLVYVVRIQHLTERISHLNSPEEATEEVAGVPSAPLSAYVSAFYAELDRLRNSLPMSLRYDKTIQASLNCAMLRLYEPPVLDTQSIISISESFASPTIGAASALDVFYQASNALRQFFDTWLSIPVSEYYFQTAPVAAQLVYAITMLGRWAKFTAPIGLKDTPTPMPDDPSSNHPLVQEYKSKRAYATSHNSTRSPSTASPTVRDEDARQIVPRETMDPRLPAAVASFKSQLKAQPGLMIGVADILSAICARFEEANARFQVAPTEPGSLDHTLWSMSLAKVRITRAKLERWAELVAAGTEGVKTNEGNATRTGGTSAGEGSSSGVGGTDTSMEDMTGGGTQGMDQMGWASGTPWTSDMLQGVDPSVWFDGYLDWGAVIMNSMGTLEQ